jgi:hypothetical protein
MGDPTNARGAGVPVADAHTRTRTHTHRLVRAVHVHGANEARAVPALATHVAHRSGVHAAPLQKDLEGAKGAPGRGRQRVPSTPAPGAAAFIFLTVRQRVGVVVAFFGVAVGVAAAVVAAVAFQCAVATGRLQGVGWSGTQEGRRRDTTLIPTVQLRSSVRGHRSKGGLLSAQASPSM